MQHLTEAESVENLDVGEASNGALEDNFAFLKNNSIYEHKRVHFHFTAYDTRRGTDIVNPGTSVTINTLYAPMRRYPVCFSLLLYYDTTLPMLD